VPTVLHAMHLGAVDVCQKPVDPDVLLPLIEHALSSDLALDGQRRQIDDARRRLSDLTPWERQLFNLVVEGKSYKEMAVALGISPRTVERHRAHITRKLQMNRLADMVRLGICAGDPSTSVPV
jgi:two-component system, LuxR family, response regulator FixJ